MLGNHGREESKLLSLLKHWKITPPPERGLRLGGWLADSLIIIIIITSYAPISSKIKLSGATKPRG